VTAYSRELGKLGLVAKGARTASSSLGSALEPLTHVRCQVYHAKNRELHTVSKAESLSTRRQLQSSYEHLRCGLLMCELVMRTQDQEQADPDVFELLRKALDVADGVNPDCAYSVSVAMRLRLAEVMGFGIRRDPCAPDWQSVSIDVSDGGATQHGHGIRLARATYDAMIRSLRGQWAPATDQMQLELESFIGMYFSHHLDSRITSRTFTALQ